MRARGGGGGGAGEGEGKGRGLVWNTVVVLSTIAKSFRADAEEMMQTNSSRYGN
jgi:hypothetical protein